MTHQRPTEPHLPGATGANIRAITAGLGIALCQLTTAIETQGLSLR